MRTTKKTVSAYLPSALFLLSVITLLWMPCAAHAAGKKADDRELAATLAEKMGVVAAEGQKFSKGRDALAKSRLVTHHLLEDSLVRLEEAKALDLRAWEVIGATFRLSLYNAVLDTTDEIVRQHEARAERRRAQEQELAQAKSAVQFQASKLRASAQSLAALAEPPLRGDRAELFNQLAVQLAGESGPGFDKMNGAKLLTDKLQAKLKAKIASDLQIPIPLDTP